MIPYEWTFVLFAACQDADAFCFSGLLVCSVAKRLYPWTVSTFIPFGWYIDCHEDEKRYIAHHCDIISSLCVKVNSLINRMHTTGNGGLRMRSPVIQPIDGMG
jgi:hypothetical protein